MILRRRLLLARAILTLLTDAKQRGPHARKPRTAIFVIIVPALAAACVAGLPGQASAAITSVKLASEVPQVVGTCPVQLNFSGIVKGTPGAVFYYWFTEQLNGAAQPLTSTHAETMPSNGNVAIPYTLTVPTTAFDPAQNFVELVASTSNNQGGLNFVSSLPSNFAVLCKTPSPQPSSTPPPVSLAPPTHLRPVLSTDDCSKVATVPYGDTTFDPATCLKRIDRGDLVLRWDAPEAKDRKFTVTETAGDQHVAISPSSSGAAEVIPKPGEGYDNTCYVVREKLGGVTSDDSAPYCYKPGATTSTKTFDPKVANTVVAWNNPQLSECNDSVPSNSQIFAAVNKATGNVYTLFFPFLLQEAHYVDSAGIGGTYVGAEVMPLSVTESDPWYSIFDPTLCTVGIPPIESEISATSGVAFDLKELANHQVTSATLSLDARGAIADPNGRMVLESGHSCVHHAHPAKSTQWQSQGGTLSAYAHDSSASTFTTGNANSVVGDVTPIVSAWAGNGDDGDNGFILTGQSSIPPSALQGKVIVACMTQYANPRLTVTYF